MLTGRVSSLAAAYATYQQPSYHVEVEGRFGLFTPRGFQSNVPLPLFERLRLLLAEKKIESTVEESSTYTQEGEEGVRLRRTVYPDGREEWDRKIRRISPIEIRDYGVRVALSTEEKISPLTDFQPSNVRHRTRQSYLLADGNARLDLTVVRSPAEDGQDKKTREVEVEFLGPPAELSRFEALLGDVFRWLYSTVLLYTRDEKSRLIADVNRLLGPIIAPEGCDGRVDTTFNIDKRHLVEARNLKSADLVWGGIIGNTDTSYTVTYKADGLRKMLIFHQTGLWMVYPPYDYNRILAGPFSELSGTIFDGEYIPIHRRRANAPRTLILYYLFDCLSWKGTTNIQRENHRVRYERASQLTAPLKTEVITVQTKDYEELTSPEQFFETMRRLSGGVDRLDYESDGYIFTPERVPYNPHSENALPLHRRVLTRLPDVCKWKPPLRLTIDFIVQGGELLSYDDKRCQLVPFDGSLINPYSPTMVDREHPLNQEIEDGSVVEYRWDGERELLTPVQIRHEKSGANRLDVAKNVWDDIHAPIELGDLQGRTFTLLYRYHNRIKKELFSSLAPGSTLLDIGTGLGGDLAKMRDLGKVVAVEPNPAYQEELQRRLDLHGMRERVRVADIGGEMSNSVLHVVEEHIGGQVDAVSLMLSTTFFWKDSATLDALVRTITLCLKPQGTILFLTLNGDAVEQLFHPVFGGAELQEITMGPATLRIGPPVSPPQGRSLYINIEGSRTVHHQEEFLPHIGDLQLRLESAGYHLQRVYRAEGERLLSQEEKLFSSLYSYGLLSGRRETKSREEKMLSPRAPPLAQEPPAPVLGAPPALPSKRMSAPPVTLRKQTVVSEVPPLPQPLHPFPPSIEKASRRREIEGEQLPSLHVEIADEDGNLLDGPGIGDDTYEPVRCSWFEGVVRIACIGDGSCFIHAFCKGFYPPYQETGDVSYRVGFASEIRRDLALSLALESADYPGYTLWETSANGSFPRLLLQQLKRPALVRELRLDFSLAGLQAHFNSPDWLGDPVYAYIADVTDIDIYVLRGTSDDLYPHVNTSVEGRSRNAVVIVGNTTHYEVIAIDRADGFQTLFSPDDPFIEAVRRLFSREEGDVSRPAQYDPEGEFLLNVIESFATLPLPPIDNIADIGTEELRALAISTGVSFPPQWERLFPPDDPFRIRLEDIQAEMGL